MSTLTDFLLAGIAGDEAAAEAAHRESMRGHAGPGFARSIVAWQDQAKDVRGRDLIGRMTPARVLADCEAKRAIVNMLITTERIEAELASDLRNQWDPFAGAKWQRVSDEASVLRQVCEDLAKGYANDPDFPEEWRS